MVHNGTAPIPSSVIRYPMTYKTVINGFCEKQKNNNDDGDDDNEKPVSKIHIL